MKKNAFNFYTLEELNQKETVNEIVDCYVHDDVHFKMLCANNDCAISRRFFWNNCYERITLEVWTALCQKINNKIILDIGAHTGVYSLSAAKSNKSNLVLSFEPFFMNYARMSTNFKINDLNPNNLFMFAVGDSNKNNNLKINTNIHYLSSGGSIVGEGNYELPIQEISLDAFIKKEDKSKVSLIKIDVEGYEPSVLIGAAEVINSSLPLIFFECNQEHVADYFNSEISLNYDFFEINDKLGTIKKISKLTSSKDYFLHNRIAVPKKNNELKKIFADLSKKVIKNELRK